MYLIFDEYSHVFLNSKDLAFRDDIEEVRSVFVPDDIFWRESRVYDLEDPAMNPDVIRILVCGNSGIGKSTLINEVFGTELVGLEMYLLKILFLVPGRACRLYSAILTYAIEFTFCIP